MIKKVSKLRERKQEVFIAILVVALIITMIQTGMVMIHSANDSNMPITGEAEFDAMYRFYMEKDMPMLQDIMEPANYAGFFVIKLATNIVGLIILVVTVVTFASALAYGAKPDIADEVHEVKMEVASGQKIPVDEPIRWIMRFMPDVKAASGIADDYEYERPTIGLVFRDNIWKFLIIFTLSILLSTHTIATFLVKTGGAAAYGVRHYVDNTDMRGIVNTFTTSGSDYNPRFDTLTTEGRNKKKTFNAMYNAVKTLDPRDRTEATLNQIGGSIHETISSQLESGETPIDFSMPNFSATADIHTYDVTPDISEIKTVLKFNADQFLPGKGDKTEGKFVYVTIVQYNDDDIQRQNREGATQNKNYFTYSGERPTGISLKQGHTSDLTTKKFVAKGDGTVTVTGYFSDGTNVATKVKLNITAGDVTGSFTELVKTIESKAKEDKKWTKITVSGISTVVGFENKADGKSAGSPASTATVSNNN